MFWSLPLEADSIEVFQTENWRASLGPNNDENAAFKVVNRIDADGWHHSSARARESGRWFAP
jgi:hypothetical protein